jgi:hypothetical protein
VTEHEARVMLANAVDTLRSNGVPEPYELNQKPNEVAPGVFVGCIPGSGIAVLDDEGNVRDEAVFVMTRMVGQRLTTDIEQKILEENSMISILRKVQRLKYECDPVQPRLQR